MKTSLRIPLRLKNVVQRTALEQIRLHLTATTGGTFTLNDVLNLAVASYVESYRQKEPDIFRPVRLEITPAHQLIVELTREIPQEWRKLYEAVCRLYKMEKDAFAGYLEDLISARRIQAVTWAAEKNVDRVLYVAFDAPLGDRFVARALRTVPEED